MADKTTGFVYVGRPTCEDCQAFQPILKKNLKKDNQTKKWLIITQIKLPKRIAII